MTGTFRRLVVWHLTLKPIEKSGKLYRWLGIEWLDGVLARAFGDDPIRPYREGRIESFDRLRIAFYKGQYSEVVNVMATLIHVTAIVLCLYAGAPILATWAAVLTGMHAVCVPIERYKRACILQWLNKPSNLTSAELVLPPRRDIKEILHPLFAPRKFETEKFYHRLGVDSFRAFVFWLASLSIKMPGDTESLHNTLKTTDIRAVDAFERTTRLAEVIHFIGIMQHVPFWVLLPMSAAPWVLVFMLWPMYMNVYALLLQRQHRTRIFRLLLRAAKQESKKAAETAEPMVTSQS